MENCYAVDECKSWADKASAIASYARQVGDKSLLDFAQRIKGRALRQIGKLLKEIGTGKAGRPLENREGARPISRTAIATEAGLSDHQRKDALRVASIPPAEFDALIESPTPPTTTKLAAIGTHKKPIDKLQGKAGRADR